MFSATFNQQCSPGSHLSLHMRDCCKFNNFQLFEPFRKRKGNSSNEYHQRTPLRKKQLNDKKNFTCVRFPQKEQARERNVVSYEINRILTTTQHCVRTLVTFVSATCKLKWSRGKAHYRSPLYSTQKHLVALGITWNHMVGLPPHGGNTSMINSTASHLASFSII